MQTPRMNAAAEPRILAKTGALVVAEDGPLVLVIDPGTGPRAVLAFVLGVFALTLGGVRRGHACFRRHGCVGPARDSRRRILALGLVAAGAAVSLSWRPGRP